MVSEAEKQAIVTAVVRDLTNLPVKVNDWLSGDVEKNLSEEGAGDVVTFVTANGWEFSREVTAAPVDRDVFIRKANGLPVALDWGVTGPQDFFFSRALEREGAEELWDAIADKKWYIGKATS